MKGVIYARVSTKEQEREGFSIPAKLKLLRNYAKEHKIEVLKEFTDSETARSSGRTSFTRMVNYLESNPECGIVLVEKTDRIYRNFKDYVTIDELDVEVHLVKEGDVISKDSKSNAKFVHGIKVLMAKNYCDNLSEEVKKGMGEKAVQGGWPSKAPLGYLNNTRTHGLDIDPEMGPIVAKLFDLYSTGEYSISSLHQEALKLGLRYKKSRNPCCRSVIEKILKNPIYMGQIRWNGKVYQGNHVPLISAGLFDEVQEKLRDVRKPKMNSRDFAFKGVLTCGYCGCAITAEMHKGKYIYYRCTNGKGKCEQPYVREENLAEILEPLAKAVYIDLETLEDLKEALRDSLDQENDFRKDEFKRLQKQHNDIQDRLNQAYTDKLENKIDAVIRDLGI